MSDIIKIRDGGDVLEIAFADVHKFHGPGSLAGAAVGFKALQAALGALCPHEPPEREELSILTGHPGPGVRDAFEMVTRAVSRGAYKVDISLPNARWNPYRELSFTFVVETADGRMAEAALREGLLPHRFFELLEAVRRPDVGEEEKGELRALKKSIAAQLTPQSASALFTVELSGGSGKAKG